MNGNIYSSYHLLVFLLHHISAYHSSRCKVDNPMLLLERFVREEDGLKFHHQDYMGPLWPIICRIRVRCSDGGNIPGLPFRWSFSHNLILGLLGFERFLMTGKLHLPVPMMILAGPIYRGHTSVMSILFVSTVYTLWPGLVQPPLLFRCHRLAAGGKTQSVVPIRNKWALKSTVVLLVVLGAIVLRLMKVPVLTATLVAGGFGVIGLGMILLVSRREGRMVHCTSYCPIGTVVNLTRFVNPFRMLHR